MRIIPYYYNSPVVVLLLSLFTCGLYQIYWNYKIAEVVNAMADREVISPYAALFAGCCLPLNLYFFYTVGAAIPDIARKVDIRMEDKSVLFLVLSFFFPMVAAMIIQSDINAFYDATGQHSNITQ